VTETNKPKTEHAGDSSKALAQQLGKIAAVVIIIIIGLVIERYCSYKPPAFGPDAKIVSIDGDSLRAGDGTEYRIFGIDAPELDQTCKEANGKSWACGRAAKARLTVLMKGGSVNCEARSKDRFGRVVALCSAQGVPDLGDAMVRQGYAIDLGGAAGNPYTRLKLRRRPPSAAFGAAALSARRIGASRTRAPTRSE
jgi:endonuclease YncB( thermonuclease family)